MKESRLLVLFSSVILGLVVVCWGRAQTASHRLTVLDDKGVPVRTLMGDQYNALIEYLETSGQTNALEMFRQYRCAYNATWSSVELERLVTAVQAVRAGNTNQAIQLLEQQLSASVSILCNSYGCLDQTNRGRVSLESLRQARDYFARFPRADWGPGLQKAMDEVLRRGQGTKQ
jgi:hypothetical protein